MVQALIGLLNAIVTAMLIGCVIGWAFAVVRWRRGEPLLRPESRLPALHGFAEVILTCGFYLVLAVVGMGLLEQFGWSPSSASEASETHALDASLAARISIDGAAKFLALLLLLGWLFLLDRHALHRFGMIPRWRDLKIGVAAAAMLIPPLMMLQFVLEFVIPYAHPVKDLIEARPTPLLGTLLAVNTVLLAPVAEEFFFRGVIQGWLQRVARHRGERVSTAVSLDGAADPAEQKAGKREMPAQTEELPVDPYGGEAYRRPTDVSRSEQSADPFRPLPSDAERPVSNSEMVAADEVSHWAWWPMVLTSIFFALVHWGHGAAPVSLFFLALGLSYLTRQTGRLWPAITVHFFLNACSTAAMFLSADTPTPPPPLGP